MMRDPRLGGAGAGLMKAGVDGGLIETEDS